MESRRFPPPWTVQNNGDAYWVEDASGQRFAYCYFRDAGSIGTGQSYLTRDQARRIATNVAKLPELIRGGLGQEENGHRPSFRQTRKRPVSSAEEGGHRPDS